MVPIRTFPAAIVNFVPGLSPPPGLTLSPIFGVLCHSMALSSAHFPRGSTDSPRTCHINIFPPLDPQLRAFLMSSSSSPALQQLHSLDKSSPGFCDQLCNLLYGEEYVRCALDLQDDDVLWLVDYLDKVSRCVTLLHSPLRPI